MLLVTSVLPAVQLVSRMHNYKLYLCVGFMYHPLLHQGRAVQYHPKYAYHNTIALVSQYTLGIDTYMIWLM